LEITTFRADTYDQVVAQSGGAFSASAWTTIWCAATSPSTRMAVRITPDGQGEFLDPLGGLAALRAKVLDTPSAPEVVVRRRSPADVACGAVRLAARVHRRTAGA